MVPEVFRGVPVFWDRVLVSQGARKRQRCCPARAFGEPGGFSEPIKVSFALPYRCEFGQHLSIIGSSDTIGNWDVGRSVSMHWSDGDVWRVELDIPASTSQSTDVHYKYIVRNTDGTVSTWKPGEDYHLRLPLDDSSWPEKIRVFDAWDSSWREIEVELRQSIPSSSQPWPNGTTSQRQAAIILTREAQEALAELKSVVKRSAALLEVVNPIAPEALEADRAVASAAQKASDLSRALNELKAKSEITESRAA